MTMNTLVLPRYTAAEAPTVAAVTRSILEYDQFDDWLPDPVYHEDVRIQMDAWAQNLEGSRVAGSRVFAEPVALAVPRRAGVAVPALVLPLDLRVSCQLTAAAFARRLQDRQDVIRDKVFGFAYAVQGPRLFSPPGEELDLAITQACEAAGRDRLFVHDVSAFARNARIDRLHARLLTAGLRDHDEWALLGGVLGSGGTGLPSVDDGFAYLFNFYLDAVDRSLLDGEHNFVRYRDEFMVFTQAACQVVTEGLSGLGMSAHADEFNLRAIDLSLEQQVTAKAEETKGEVAEGEAEVGRLPTGVLRYLFKGLGWTGDAFTDGAERAYDLLVDEEGPQPALAQELHRLFSAGFAVPDAVTLLPIVRAVHRLRARHALDRPELPAPADYQGYRSVLSAQRGALIDWLDGATAAQETWTTAWLGRLLSDAGMLSPADATRVATWLDRPGSTEARSELRLLLARSSSLPVGVIWPGATVELPASHHASRCEAVAASFARRRGFPQIWSQVAESVQASDPRLFSLLNPLTAT